MPATVPGAATSLQALWQARNMLPPCSLPLQAIVGQPARCQHLRSCPGWVAPSPAMSCPPRRAWLRTLSQLVKTRWREATMLIETQSGKSTARGVPV